MKNLYEIHQRYIWQNLTIHPEFNGKEVIVISDIKEFSYASGEKDYGQYVDEVYNGKPVAAFKGQLRRKELPSGEKIVQELVKKCLDKQLEECV